MDANEGRNLGMPQKLQRLQIKSFSFSNDQRRQRMYNDEIFQREGFGAVDTGFKQYRE